MPEITYRIDIEVFPKKSEYFWGNNSYLGDSNGVQYERSYNSNFEFGDLQQGTVRRGYLLFEEVPKNASLTKLTINNYVFDLVTRKGYTYEQIAEEAFKNSVAILNQTLRKGKFEVTASRAGFFTDYQDGETYFRVDIRYENIGTKPEYFSTSMFLLDGQGSQFEETYGGTLDTHGEVFPGVAKEGYVLFENVPSNSTNLNLTFELGYDENYDPHLFRYRLT